MSLSPGTRLGPYEIVALLGAGGMGEADYLVMVRNASALLSRHAR